MTKVNLKKTAINNKPWVRYFVVALVLVFLSFVHSQVQAQEINSQEPLEITAENYLEWDRKAKTFTADKKAQAKQGDTILRAQQLIAHYQDNTNTKTPSQKLENVRNSDEENNPEASNSDFKIWQVTASQDVEIYTHESTAFGQEAIYNLDKGYAVMKGDNLKLVSPDQIVSAKESFEYWVLEGKLVAHKDAMVIRGEDTLQADTIAAIFEDNEKGERVLKTVEATGNVIITTPKEKLTGNYAVYRSETNKAKVTGAVKISRGPNVLEGERAEVDLSTNISTIYGSSSSQGRVRGVFYPSSEKK